MCIVCVVWCEPSAHQTNECAFYCHVYVMDFMICVASTRACLSPHIGGRNLSAWGKRYGCQKVGRRIVDGLMRLPNVSTTCGRAWIFQRPRQAQLRLHRWGAALSLPPRLALSPRKPMQRITAKGCSRGVSPPHQSRSWQPCDWGGLHRQLSTYSVKL